MDHELTHRYTHVEAGLVENVVIRRTTDTNTYPSGWKYTLHLGTLQDLTLIRYDNAHEDTKGHELHTAAGDTDLEFPGMEELLLSSGPMLTNTGTPLAAIHHVPIENRIHHTNQ
ncbi:hypothetical protein BDK88_4151 [Natrinema hispanicum]|uniref:Uncharacterized protein n=1 Tax=Natrinema hispanicum TaxID=392421 RepID=A0A482Y8I7_9EURY|nr:DUF6516 family protein [Natrinema hispanicum]RZV06187.1 hypothetical protein BDK88_4151 [Natrinema hispanicum]